MKPEILAPAGSREALQAALTAGAEAVYFGLDEGFNARARAQNFPLEQLASVVEEIHAARARAYLTLNILVFDSELATIEKILRAAAQAGVDALIVQDPALCWMARHICPQLELHASTQMTISSPEAARLARRWGISRVVLPRELSLQEIERFARATPDMELEVFISGALCMSWSGQCLSSEAWGGRSANRGQCAQACRHEYDLIVDGQPRPLGAMAYLLSPHDLGGFAVVDQLAQLGIHTLKIEGRQKDADYVFQAVRAVRAARDGSPDLDHQVQQLELSYSRGLGPGFFQGSDHQSLVKGDLPRHRGILLGKIQQLQGSRCWVQPVCELQVEAGMGVVFRGPHKVEQTQEQGGPLFSARQTQGQWELGFGRPGPDLRRVRVGDEVWVTGSPRLAKERQAARSRRRWPLRLEVSGELGQPLRVEARWQHGLAQSQSASTLQAARSGGLEGKALESKLGSWGDSDFEIEELAQSGLQPALFLPVSELKAVRATLRETLQAQLRELGKKPVQAALQPAPVVTPGPSQVVLEPLVRTPEQLEAVIEAGLPGVTLDWMELVGLKAAVERARQAGLKVGVATVRVQKPGEEGYDRRLAALAPDWLLARHWGAVMHFAEAPPFEVHGDFSLNVSNSITAALLIELGLTTVTAAHDLDQRQLERLLERFEPSRVAVTLHHHIATFHTEHCTYAHLLSQGRDYRDCGRPCEQHLVELQDRKQIRHPVIVDVGCRNTVFNGVAQSCVSLLPALLRRGVRRFRLEFVRESKAETLVVLKAYQDVLEGRLEASAARQRIGAHEQFGVSLGTMAVLE